MNYKQLIKIRFKRWIENKKDHHIHRKIIKQQGKERIENKKPMTYSNGLYKSNSIDFGRIFIKSDPLIGCIFTAYRIKE